MGEAVSLELARQGYDIAGVHLDRKATMPNVERIVNEIRATGRQAKFFNINAADADLRSQTLDQLKNELGPQCLSVMLHSIAFGSLRRYASGDPQEWISQAQVDMTLDVMANSLIYWTQGVIQHDLMGPGGHIFAMTSSGSHRVLPQYGAVGAAKAALEAHCRQLAVELAPGRIAVNAIQAGVTETPASRKIPGSDQLFDHARRLNPGGRMTVPQDVADLIAALVRIKSGWVTGNVIRTDGAEDII